MDASGTSSSNRQYYDAFSQGYEDQRGHNDPGGYHDMLDELEADFVARYGTGRDVLEVGCGTGLVLQRISRFAASAKGLDLSPGMLEKARERGLNVVEGSATELPFPNESFDVTCSFKVLAHIPEIELVLREMARVTRVDGVIIAEFYNPHSLRGILKRFGPKGRIADNTHEGHVYTRFDSPADVRRMIPRRCKLIDARGIRIVTPSARAMQVPIARQLLRRAEWALCDTPLKNFGGFWVAAIRKEQ